MTLAPAVQPHHFPLIPLAQVPPLAPLLDERTKRALMIIVALLAAALFIWWMASRSRKAPVTRNRPAKKMSTPELAKNLYERLEKRRGTSPATLRSLQAYASKR